MPEFEAPPQSPAEQGPPASLARLLVGYDGSDGANAATAFALWLSGNLGCEVTVIHAGPTTDLLPAPDQVAAYEHEWMRRLETLRNQATRDAVVNLRVLRGRAAGTLIAAARDSGADLILIGSRGAGRVRGALLGSVSSQVLTHAPCSVMLFNVAEPSTPAARARSVVVGIDGSPSSLYALEIAEALAVPLGAKLVLVHAYDPHIPLAVMTTEGIRELLRNHGHEVLVAARDALNEPLDVHEQVVEARARDALIAACEQHTPALAVVGSRGLHGFQELLVGSTSRYLADHAPCPVLVARRPPQRSDSR